MLQHILKSLQSCNPFKSYDRKVIFLGAGASVDAGYPLTSNLYKVLESDHKNSPNVTDREAWHKFSATIDGIKLNYAEFSDCENIEYLMTILSLSHSFHEGKSIPNSIADAKEHFDKFIESNKTASTYEAAKNSFAICIESTFAQMDYDMGEERFIYLKDFFKKNLKSDDTIITTNYDLLSERCLQKEGMWNVHDGYGFKVSFRDKDAFLRKKNKNEKINAYNSKNSNVKILKLHGSVGWLNGENKIVIDTSSMQHHISKYWEDENYSPTIYDNKHLILPDFIKYSGNETMTSIWAQAQQAILNANEAHIIGFSLPEYDANIRTLLLPLRTKIIEDKCKVHIYILNTDKASKNRWINLLTDNIKFIEYNSLKDYCQHLK
jgi:hypothetical protein